jgi:hypothetical protein
MDSKLWDSQNYHTSAPPSSYHLNSSMYTLILSCHLRLYIIFKSWYQKHAFSWIYKEIRTRRTTFKTKLRLSSFLTNVKIRWFPSLFLRQIYSLAKSVLHKVRFSAFSFNFQFPLLSFSSSSSCLRLLFRLPVTSSFQLSFNNVF